MQAASESLVIFQAFDLLKKSVSYLNEVMKKADAMQKEMKKKADEMIKSVGSMFKKTDEEKNNEALEEMANWAQPNKKTKFPEKLVKYLSVTKFLVEVPTSYFDNQVLPFEFVFDNERAKAKGLAPGTSIEGNRRRCEGLFVKMIERSSVPPKAAISIFKAGNFATVDLSRPGSSPWIVATSQLQGCSFVIGQDSTNENLLYLGHAQPGGGSLGTESSDLKIHFENADSSVVFESKTLANKYVIGGSGAHYIGLLGWVTGGKLFLATQTTSYADRTNLNLQITEFPAAFPKPPSK